MGGTEILRPLKKVFKNKMIPGHPRSVRFLYFLCDIYTHFYRKLYEFLVLEQKHMFPPPPQKNPKKQNKKHLLYAKKPKHSLYVDMK